MLNLTIVQIGSFVAFLVTLISGVAYLKANIRNWIVDAVKDDIDSLGKEIDTLDQKLDAMQKEMNRINDERLKDKADSARYRILRFNDEMRHGMDHTLEHYDQIIDDIDSYEKFCSTHRDYTNNKAKQSILNIKTRYNERSPQDDFI